MKQGEEHCAMRMKGKLLMPGLIRDIWRPIPLSISSLVFGFNSTIWPFLLGAVREEGSQGHMKAQRVWDWGSGREDRAMKNFIPSLAGLLIGTMMLYKHHWRGRVHADQGDQGTEGMTHHAVRKS